MELRKLLLFMLKQQLPYILALGSEDLFRYVSNGWFIKDIFLQEACFEELVANFLTPLNEK